MIIKVPNPLPIGEDRKSVFLAGSIDMGTAENWQDIAAKYLDDNKYIVLNPRRDDWDSSWNQSI